MTNNPYPTQPGFGLRVRHARTALEKFGRDYQKRPYTRGFDNCFEMFDGDAVVWTLMNEAVPNPNGDLAEGIRRMGKNVWPHWLDVYKQQGDYAPRQEQLNLLTEAPASPKPKGNGPQRHSNGLFLR